MKKIGLLTSSNHAGLIPDDSSLLSAGSKLGLELIPLVWDRPQDWASFAAVVVRTPWDYVTKKEQFRSVLERISSQTLLINPLKTQLWNFDKRYLFELQDLKLAVPKTVLMESHDPIGPLRTIGTDVVVKPVISAGGFETYHLTQAELAQFDWKKLPWDTHQFMAQEFLPAILTEGEYSLVYFDSQFSHALRKTPKAGEFRVQDDHGGRVHAWTPSSQDIAEADAIVRALPYEQTYCRVDLARHPNGKLMIMEVELIEPELFFRFGTDGESRFLNAVKRRLQ